MDKKLTRILNNISDYTFFKYLGDVDIFELSKCEIKDIIKAIKKVDDNNINNSLWNSDKKYLINKINEYCTIYRCYSLYIK